MHDEETYTCSVTYLEPSESCESNGSYKIKLNVLGMYCSDRVTTMKTEWENKAHYEMLLLILFVFFFYFSQPCQKLYSCTINNANARWNRTNDTKWYDDRTTEWGSTICELLWGPRWSTKAKRWMAPQRKTVTRCVSTIFLCVVFFPILLYIAFKFQWKIKI